MNSSNKFYIFLLLIGVAWNGWAEEENGGYAGNFTNHGVGVRAISMGHGYTAVASDGSALFWNPAGLGQIGNRQMIVEYALLFEDRTQNFAVFSLPFNHFSISAGWLRFSVADIQERDHFGQLLGTFNTSENLFMLGSGITLLKNSNLKLNTGLTATYFYNSIFDYQAKGFGANIGALLTYSPSIYPKKIKLGITIKNLGAELQWNTTSELVEQIPIAYRLGTAVTPPKYPFTVVLDVEKIENRNINFYSGVEYKINYLALRTGYASNRFTLGAGLTIMKSLGAIIFDYALVSDKMLDRPVHYFSAGFEF